MEECVTSFDAFSKKSKRSVKYLQLNNLGHASCEMTFKLNGFT